MIVIFADPRELEHLRRLRDAGVLNQIMLEAPQLQADLVANWIDVEPTGEDPQDGGPNDALIFMSQGMCEMCAQGLIVL